MTPRLLTFGARLGFGLLLAGLVAFELLFVREAREAVAAQEASRALKQARGEAALDEALRGALEVGLTRLEVVETLPLADEDGLLWVQRGVQRLPRLAGASGSTGASGGRGIAGVLTSALGRPPPDALVAEVEQALRRGERPAALPGVRWTAAMASALGAERWETAGEDAALRVALWTWLVEQATEVPEETVSATLPALVLRAWPWLTRDEAASACVRAQRVAAARRLDTERLAAACQRGLAGTVVQTAPGREAHLVGDWLMVERADGIQGVRVSVAEVLSEVEGAMRKRGALGDDERVVAAGGLPSPRPSPPRGEGDMRSTPSPRGGEGRGEGIPAAPLISLRVESPSLDRAAETVRSTLALKSALLAVTALLGLGIVLLARLAARRREETLAVQREFIATVSHELRTPLAGIRLLAETLERKLAAESATRDYPRRLVRAADALGFLVENILSFNRLDSGRWTPRREPFDLARLEPLLRDDAALAVDAEVQVHCEGLAALPSLEVDPELLRILVLNLLRNAWKYGQRQPVRFTVTGALEGGEVVLRFADNGPGIPAESWEAVFAAFHRLQTAERQVGGSGLGLALARKIATLHGGSLRIVASSAEGTCFELRVPCR